MEQIAFGVDIAASKEKLKAAARTVVGMWEKEYYEEHSRYLEFPRRMVTPKPYQFPHPPAWMAASSESSAIMAGENGCGLLCFSIMQPLSKLRGILNVYQEAQKRAKPLTGVHTNKVGIYTLVHCAKSRSDFEANRLWESIWWWYTTVAQFLLKWEFAEPHRLTLEVNGNQIKAWCGECIFVPEGQHDRSLARSAWEGSPGKTVPWGTV